MSYLDLVGNLETVFLKTKLKIGPILSYVYCLFAKNNSDPTKTAVQSKSNFFNKSIKNSLTITKLLYIVYHSN